MDKMNITVLEDGTLKVETDKISGGNHIGAERLILELIKAQGGASKRERRGHHHHHGHEHTHEEEHHEH